MKYGGREIDPVALWSRYVEFPSAMRLRDDDAFSPLVQCPNPEHDTHKRHFQVNVHEPLVHCFAYCGISGTYEHAVCVIEGLYDKYKVEEAGNDRERKRRTLRARKEARKILLRGAGKTTQISRSPSARKKTGNSRPATSVPLDSLLYDSFLPQVALEYLNGRRISPLSISTWQLGWLPEERRIAIPARDENGRLKFLIKRAVRERDQPKYLYSEGFPKTSLLFGACQIDMALIKCDGMNIVEGSLDAIRLHQHGLRNTVAILGTGISQQQQRIVARINPPRIYLWFDKDSAGIRNIEIAYAKLKKYPLYIVRYPKGKSDPATLTRREAWNQRGKAVPAAKFMRTTGLNARQPRKEQQVGYYQR